MLKYPITGLAAPPPWTPSSDPLSALLAHALLSGEPVETAGWRWARSGSNGPNPGAYMGSRL